jgi:hypothetical protein
MGIRWPLELTSRANLGIALRVLSPPHPHPSGHANLPPQNPGAVNDSGGPGATADRRARADAGRGSMSAKSAPFEGKTLCPRMAIDFQDF